MGLSGARAFSACSGSHSKPDSLPAPIVESKQPSSSGGNCGGRIESCSNDSPVPLGDAAQSRLIESTDVIAFSLYLVLESTAGCVRRNHPENQRRCKPMQIESWNDVVKKAKAKATSLEDEPVLKRGEAAKREHARLEALVLEQARLKHQKAQVATQHREQTTQETLRKQAEWASEHPVESRLDEIIARLDQANRSLTLATEGLVRDRSAHLPRFDSYWHGGANLGIIAVLGGSTPR